MVAAVNQDNVNRITFRAGDKVVSMTGEQLEQSTRAAQGSDQAVIPLDMVFEVRGVDFIDAPDIEAIATSLIGAYAEDLADIPPVELRQVCRDLWLSETWFPPVQLIRMRWLDLRGPLPFDADQYQTRRIRRGPQAPRPMLRQVS